jgi:uncharacterized protein
MPPTIHDLRRFAVARSLFRPTTLGRAMNRLGFVQADPIRAPARAQDLTLRHRVSRYRAGDLDRRYAALNLEEDVFINYGFLTPEVHALMHPRPGLTAWPAGRRTRAEAILDFIVAHGTVRPRDVERRFAHGTVTNYWGGSSNATTHMLERLHYLGLLRVVGREAGIRLYAARPPLPAPPDRSARAARLDGLVEVLVGKYAPLPRPSLATLVARLRYAVPQWHRDLKGAFERATRRLTHARVDDVEWYWPAGESIEAAPDPADVRLLAPFDPVVWDRRRFERLWGWAYRFEAYTPVAKRTRGYYALPLLWQEHVIGWGNVAVEDGRLRAQLGYVGGHPPGSRAFRAALEAELERLSAFLEPRETPAG